MSDREHTDALLKALVEAKIPRTVIARTLVIAPSAVTALFSGGRQLKYEEAIKLRALLGQTGGGVRELPLIGMAGAGNWLEALEDADRKIFVPESAVGKFAVEVVGDSMNLLIPEGSSAIIDPDSTSLFDGKIYLLQNEYGEGTIKRYRTDPARFEPVSSNPAHMAFELGKSDLRIIGRVTSSLNNF